VVPGCGPTPDDPRPYDRTVIVVIGSPLHVPGDDDRSSIAEGLPVRIAQAAVASGGAVQLVGSVGEDPAGDATLLALARDGIGHAATRRDPSRVTPAMPPSAAGPEPDIDEVVVLGDDDGSPGAASSTALGPHGSAELDGADLELALRYLDGVRVVVVAERLGSDATRAVELAAAFVGATVIVLTGAAATDPAPADPDPASRGEVAPTIVIEAPEADPEGIFARTVGAFAAALDAGVDPGVALETAAGAAGWQHAEG